MRKQKLKIQRIGGFSKFLLQALPILSRVFLHLIDPTEDEIFYWVLFYFLTVGLVNSDDRW